MIPRTMASEMRYWIRTTGEVEVSGCVRMVVKSREPGGLIQVFVPRPRPEVCVVAVKTVPGGREVRRRGFWTRRVLVEVVVRV